MTRSEPRKVLSVSVVRFGLLLFKSLSVTNDNSQSDRKQIAAIAQI